MDKFDKIVCCVMSLVQHEFGVASLTKLYVVTALSCHLPILKHRTNRLVEIMIYLFLCAYAFVRVMLCDTYITLKIQSG